MPMEKLAGYGMFVFTPQELAAEISAPHRELILYHGRDFIPRWGQQNLLLRFQTAVECLPQSCTIGISGEHSSQPKPWMLFEMHTADQLSVLATLKSIDRQPELYISKVTAENQRQGALRQFFPGFLRFGQKMGAAHAALCATGIGRYAWARMGFWPENTQSIQLMQEHLTTILVETGYSSLREQRDRSIVANVQQALSANPRAIRQLFTINQSYGDKNFAQHFFSKMCAWSGRLNLGSRSGDVVYANRYCHKRAGNLPALSCARTLHR